MNWQGWIFMLIAWVLVSGLFFYSFYHILFDKGIQQKRKGHSVKGRKPLSKKRGR